MCRSERAVVAFSLVIPTSSTCTHRLSALKITRDIAEAADFLRYGGIVAYPTDTFYGLGADALNEDAVQRVFEIKARAPQSPVPILIPNVQSIGRFVRAVPPTAMALASRFWPGALTIVMPANDLVPANVRAGTPTVGLRVPDHGLALELLTEFDGGIVGTSANMTGAPPMKLTEDVAQAFDGIEGLLLDGACGPHTQSSTVINITQSTPIIQRNGAITRDEISQVIIL